LIGIIPAQAGIQYKPVMKHPCVYILASRRNGTLYTGVTSGLIGRVWQHKNGQGSRFTAEYRVHTLVWFEAHETMENAITREKQIKEWKRDWKIALIEKSNPEWRDLYADLSI
jgi:putative endonuclease|tara:strand:- start:263 stop:601 length:339 start_codon:yes stop_codon:yes gene_type:complete